MKSSESWDILRMLWKSQRGTIVTTLSIIGVVVTLIYGLYTYREHQLRKHLMEADTERIFDDPAGEERVLTIAGHFNCVTCDSCKNMPLVGCDCKSGKAERNYIRGEIVSHSDDSVVVRHIASLFGGLKERKNER